MKQHYILIGIILLLLVSIGVYIVKNNSKNKIQEKFFVDPNSPIQNPFDFPPDYRRPNNTLLMSQGLPVKDTIDKLTLPEEVKDEFTEWIDRGLIRTSKDQKDCGGCWAFATTDSLSDRIQIATNGKWMPPFGLSAQELISCGNEMNMSYYNGCFGGLPQFAFRSLRTHGVKLDKFDPQAPKYNPSNEELENELSSDYTYYQLGTDANTSCVRWRTSTCPCDKVKEIIESKPLDTAKTKFDIKHINKNYSTADGGYLITSHGEQEEKHEVELWPDIPDNIIKRNVDRLKKEIYYNGPVTAGIRITSDFYDFNPEKDNFYQYDGRSQSTGGHAVCIVGWKKVGDIPVWICRNSWGERWGYGFDKPVWKNPITSYSKPKYGGGFWNHRMGINDSFIESNCTAAHPDLTHLGIKDKLSKPVEPDYYKNKTIRDIYLENQDKDTDDHNVGMKVVDYNMFMFPFNQMPTNVLINLFRDKKNIAIICSTNPNVAKQILELVNTMIVINHKSVQLLVQKLSKKISDEIILALRGTMDAIYYCYGSPIKWNILNLSLVVNQSTHPEVVADRIFHQIMDLRTNTKITNFQILLLSNNPMTNNFMIGNKQFTCQCRGNICECNENSNVQFRALDTMQQNNPLEPFSGLVHPYPPPRPSFNQRWILSNKLSGNPIPNNDCLSYNEAINDMLRRNSYPYVDPVCGKMQCALTKQDLQKFYPLK